MSEPLDRIAEAFPAPHRGTTYDWLSAQEAHSLGWNEALIFLSVNLLPKYHALAEAARALVDSAVLVPIEQEEDDPAEFWCVHSALASARAALAALEAEAPHD